jgi:hypothetical protein
MEAAVVAPEVGTAEAGSGVELTTVPAKLILWPLVELPGAGELVVRLTF